MNRSAIQEPGTGAKGANLTFRLYRDGDIPAIVPVINAAYEAGYADTPISEEGLAASYAQPFSQPEHQVILAEDPNGEIAGFARYVCFDDAAGDERLYQMRVLVRPPLRGRGVEQALATRMMENIRANEREPGMEPRGKVSLLALAAEKAAPEQALMEEMGLRPIRHAWVMERSLDLPIAEPVEVEGLTIRTYSRPEDNAAMTQAYNNSFIDHFEFHAFTQEMMDYRIGRPDVRPELSWVAEIEAEPGELAGFCICEINEQESERSGDREGWIAELGTIRGWRGMGLGRSLLLRGLRSLKEAGMETALLGVDSQNLTGANRLYESVGFTIRSHQTLYKCELSEARM
jgi:mycothiol synthase